VIPRLGGVEVEPAVEARVRESARALIAANGMVEVDVRLELPNLAAQWMIGNLATLLAELGDRWPACAPDLTDEIAIGLYLSQSLYNLRAAAVAEELRVRAYKAMAAAFDEVDFIIAATNPSPAFAADAATSSPSETFVDSAKASPAARFAFRGLMGGVRAIAAAFPNVPSWLLDQVAVRFPDLVQMGGLTMISNLYGNPAVSIPVGHVDGLPVGLQVLARHHADALLFDVALAVERDAPWPLVAPGPLRSEV
jgi:Asp-tRNA(Asn)/Glu-tRNA(Gln) amidotransferase A subunit family amidase